MKRISLMTAMLCLCGAALASAAPAAAPAPTTPQAGATARVPAKRPMVAPAQVKPKPKASASKAAVAKPSVAKTRPKPGSEAGGEAAKRQLQDIHIEGEIPVPQVLFITAREQRRFMDFQHRRYLRTSQEVGEQAVFPTRIAVIGQPPMEARKETSP